MQARSVTRPLDRPPPDLYPLCPAMSDKPIFALERLTKSYQGKKPVLKDISLVFLEGAKIGVIGQNGAGKSTLLRIMAGVEKEYDGVARLAGLPRHHQRRYDGVHGHHIERHCDAPLGRKRMHRHRGNGRGKWRHHESQASRQRQRSVANGKALQRP